MSVLRVYKDAHILKRTLGIKRRARSTPCEIWATQMNLTATDVIDLHK